METEVTKSKTQDTADQSGDHERVETPELEEMEELEAIEITEVTGKMNKDGKLEYLEQADIDKLQPGKHYDLSINGEPVEKYAVRAKDKRNGTVQLQKQKPGSKHDISVNIKNIRIQRFKSKGTMEREKYATMREEIEEALKDDAPILSPEEIEEAIDLTGLTLLKMISSGIKNIWMVGPAGCGKSTIARIVAKQLNYPIHVISCGIGTSSTEFIGYKYPERETTPFSDYYVKPSIILLDEFTALDPSVAQIANAALANDELYTTTGLISRDPACIIIATSNTYGTGGDMSYVANNQLDASTIDRFVGGIIEVEYSKEYESQFDKEIVDYVYMMRHAIKENSLQRIASTRMIINAVKLKAVGLNWRKLLVSNWTPEDRELLKIA